MAEFKIGLAMSGAISAGAYSAGVYDFLIEALEEWEAEKKIAKNESRNDVPQHQVILAVMAGASAGSITCSVGALAACCGLNTTRIPGVKITDQSPADHVLPDLYSAWVEGPDFLDTFTTPQNENVGSLLTTEDLQAGKPVASILNSHLLRHVGVTALSKIGAGKPSARPYFPQNLHLYLTLSNLRGVPYKIDFSAAGGGTEYKMMCHRDWAHYRLDNIGQANYSSDWADGVPIPRATPPIPPDPAVIPLDVRSLPSTPRGFKAMDWNAFLENTLASGAFPVGLSARQLENILTFYDSRHWPLPVPLSGMANLKPSWPAGSWSSTPTPHINYGFAAADGGAIDNDPFQFARYALMKWSDTTGMFQPLERNPKLADRAVIMITPFPEPPEFQTNYDAIKACSLLAVIKRIIPMFVQQNRFKPEEVFSALDPDWASRWMIAPQRYDLAHKPEPYGIACGLLGGFGGFLDRQFREHDYELGRKNCQDFLAGWFGVDNTDDTKKPKVDTTNPVQLPQQPPSLSPAAGSGQARIAIIPLYGTAKTAVEVRDWPRIPKQKLDRFMNKAMDRLDKIKDILEADLGIMGKAWIGIAWSLEVKDKLRDWILFTVLADLVKRDQFDDNRIRGHALTPDERKVLQACIEPTYDYRWANGIAEQLDGVLSVSQVAAILDSLRNRGLLDTFWRGVDTNGKLVGRAATGLAKLGSWVGFSSNNKPIYTYIDRQKSMLRMPSDPSVG